MLTLKKYKGTVDTRLLEKLINDFLRANKDANVRTREVDSYSILVGDEGIDVGVLTKSQLAFTAVNPTELSLSLAKLLAVELGLHVYKNNVVGSTPIQTRISVEDLQTEDLR